MEADEQAEPNEIMGVKMDFRERDYSIFEGKKINFSVDDDVIGAVIIGCDYYIGIAAVFEEFKHEHVFCLHGPFSPYRPKEFNQVGYDAFFCTLIEVLTNSIENKEPIGILVLMEEATKIFDSCSTEPSSVICPFGA